MALLLSGPQGPFLDTKLELADIAYEVLLATGIRIQPLPVREEEWDHPETYTNPRLLQEHHPRGHSPVSAEELMANLT